MMGWKSVFAVRENASESVVVVFPLLSAGWWVSLYAGSHKNSYCRWEDGKWAKEDHIKFSTDLDKGVDLVNIYHIFREYSQ